MVVMIYNYDQEKPRLFTEVGQEMLLKVWDNGRDLIAKAGAVRVEEMLRGVSGDTFLMVACVDRLIEMGKMVEVTDKSKVWGQHRVLTLPQA